jgi:choline dehydrogenase-like flavoprotein
VVEALGEHDGGPVRLRARSFVLAAGAVNSAAMLLASADDRHPQGLANSSGLVGRNYMVHNATFLVAIDPRQTNSAVFQKTLMVNDWYLRGPDGYPLGNVQMLGKLRAPMVKPARPHYPRWALNVATTHTSVAPAWLAPIRARPCLMDTTARTMSTTCSWSTARTFHPRRR